jgi:hypothetical protein
MMQKATMPDLPAGTLHREIERLAMEVITVLPILLIIDLFWWLR